MKSWSLSQKIWGVLFILCTSYIGSNTFAVFNMLSLRDDLNEVSGPIVRRDQLTSGIKDNQRRITIQTYQIILQDDPKLIAEAKKSFDDAVAKQEKDLAEYTLIASEKELAELALYKKFYYSYLDTAKKTVEIGEQNKDKEATALILGAEDVRKELLKQLDLLNEMTSAQLAHKSKEANTAANRAILISIISAAAVILFALSIAFLVLKSVTSAIGKVVKSLFESSQHVSVASDQIGASSQQLSQASTQQAASLEQTAAAIEQLNAMTLKNSENATATATTSEKSQGQATQGKNVIEKMIGSMGTITESNDMIIQQVNRSNENMASIIKVIEEISAKTRVINDIVFQTKLLSFNASVEAARAGEQGKGFAVVAQEVGNLAQMSGNASKEISHLLDESIQKVNAIVNESKNSIEKLVLEGKEAVESGTQVAHECGDVLDEIVKNVSSVSTMAGEIATASQEQSRGVSEITKAMSQLDQTTQQNAATSQECASAAEALSVQSDSLKAAVELLMLTVSGQKGQEQADSESRSPRPVSVNSRKSKKVAPSNVMNLKSKNQSAWIPVQKVSGGDTPDYNDDGFEDV